MPMKTHGEILRELSHEQHISREEIQDAFGKNNAQAVYNLFKKETFSRPEVVVACMLLKVPPSVFGEKENFFETRRFQDFVKGLRGDLSVDSKLAYDESFSFDQLSYEKTEDYDFAVAEEYWEETQEFWSVVRASWETALAEPDTFYIAPRGEKRNLFTRVFNLSDEFTEGTTDLDGVQAELAVIVGDHLRTGEAATTAGTGDLAAANQEEVVEPFQG